MTNSTRQPRKPAAEERPAQQDPAEGSRDVVERELKRQDETDSSRTGEREDKDRRDPPDK